MFSWYLVIGVFFLVFGGLMIGVASVQKVFLGDDGWRLYTAGVVVYGFSYIWLAGTFIFRHSLKKVNIF